MKHTKLKIASTTLFVYKSKSVARFGTTNTDATNTVATTINYPLNR
jgi:hypothetical protein